MARRFNTAGPNQPEIHYTLPALRRLPSVGRLIDGRSYFVLHAPRQVGKTTTLQTLAQELTAEGRYAAVLVSTEAGVAFPDDPGRAEQAVEVVVPDPAKVITAADVERARLAHRPAGHASGQPGGAAA